MPSSTQVHQVVHHHERPSSASNLPNPHKGRLLPVCCLPLVACWGGTPTDLGSQQGHDDVVDHRHDVVVGHRGAVGEEPLHHQGRADLGDQLGGGGGSHLPAGGAAGQQVE